MSITAPAASPAPEAENTLFTPTDCITSVSKNERDMFLYSGSSEGIGNPLSIVVLYLSPNPRTNTFFTPSCLLIPEIFCTAPSASLTPFLESSLAPTA